MVFKSVLVVFKGLQWFPKAFLLGGGNAFLIFVFFYFGGGAGGAEGV